MDEHDAKKAADALLKHILQSQPELLHTQHAGIPAANSTADFIETLRRRLIAMYQSKD